MLGYEDLNNLEIALDIPDLTRSSWFTLAQDLFAQCPSTLERLDIGNSKEACRLFTYIQAKAKEWQLDYSHYRTSTHNGILPSSAKIFDAIKNAPNKSLFVRFAIDGVMQFDGVIPDYDRNYMNAFRPDGPFGVQMRRMYDQVGLTASFQTSGLAAGFRTPGMINDYYDKTMEVALTVISIPKNYFVHPWKAGEVGSSPELVYTSVCTAEYVDSKPIDEFDDAAGYGISHHAPGHFDREIHLEFYFADTNFSIFRYQEGYVDGEIFLKNPNHATLMLRWWNDPKKRIIRFPNVHESREDGPVIITNHEEDELEFNGQVYHRGRYQENQSMP